MNKREFIAQRTGEPVWRKSSRSSDPDMAQCVEIASVYPGVSWVVQTRS